MEHHAEDNTELNCLSGDAVTIIVLQCVPQKRKTSNSWLYVFQFLSNFPNSFTCRLSSKFCSTVVIIDGQIMKWKL